MASLLETRAGLRTLLRETQKLIAFYEGCYDADDAVRLHTLSAAKISIIRHKVGKYATWLAKNVAAFRPLELLPPARWLVVNAHLPEGLRNELETHRETIRERRNAIESDAQTPFSLEDFAHRYGYHVGKAQEAIRGLVGVFERFESEVCHRLETNTAGNPAAKVKSRGRKTKREPLTPAELRLLQNYKAARRQGTPRKDICKSYGITLRELLRLQGKVRAKRGRVQRKNTKGKH